MAYFRPMRGSILLLFVLVSAGIHCQNLFQTNHARWWVQHKYPDATMEQPSFRSTRTTHWGFAGDSLIQDTLWQMMWHKEDSVLLPPWDFAGLVHASGDMVWMKDSLGNSRLIYDFSLTVGDSAWYSFSGFKPAQYLYVLSEDSVLTASGYRKRIRFSEPTGPTAFDVVADSWIEGIGSIREPLFPANPRSITTEMQEELFVSCAGTALSLLWQSPDGANCYAREVMHLEGFEQSVPLPYPNPFSTVIRWEAPALHNWNYSLFDQYGRRIANGRTDNSKGISTPELPPGMYILLLEQDARLHSFRMLKSR